MFSHLFSRETNIAPKTPARHRERTTRNLTFQPLESRTLMATIPALSSLPGATRSLYLDFDGDFQTTWTRTDSNQTYNNVNAGQFDLDNTLGFSNAEASAMQKIWETVAEDYAPFNINVTTVVPPSFANGAAVRVVMGGQFTAQLRTGPSTTINISGNRFIADNTGNLVDTSGYASVGSYSDAQPNVVYVFAKYINTWGTTDSEGRTRDLKYVMATTASHEAGHSFGLVHHGNYDVGTNITTPIMGSNTQGDRSLWSSYGTNNNIQQLTNLLGARADDYGNSYNTGTNFLFSNTSLIYGNSGSMKGIVSTATDTDWFRFTSSGATFNFNVSTLQFANLDARVEIYRITQNWWGTTTQLVYAVDPQVNSFNPFSNLGASFAISLASGKYAAVVRSHGGYGDLGNYTLRISVPTQVIINPPIVLASSSGGGSGGGTNTAPSGTTNQAYFSAGQGAGSPAKKSNVAAVDQLFATW